MADVGPKAGRPPSCNGKDGFPVSVNESDFDRFNPNRYKIVCFDENEATLSISVRNRLKISVDSKAGAISFQSMRK